MGCDTFHFNDLSFSFDTLIYMNAKIQRFRARLSDGLDHWGRDHLRTRGALAGPSMPTIRAGTAVTSDSGADD